MRWYEDFPQIQLSDDRCPVCKKDTCRNSPTVKEKERSAVLNISRAKMAQQQLQQHQQKSSCCDKWNSTSKTKKAPTSAASPDLRRVVGVRNTVRRLEADMHAEIMAAFAAPVPMA